MYCVIQEIKTKKEDKGGYAKELKSEFMQCSIGGKDYSHYYYSYSDERFNRLVKKAYRISIHESYRENGKVKKRQFAICTVNYYDLATDMFSLYDWGGRRIKATADTLQVDEGVIYDLIEKKLQPIWGKIVDEFQQTEEYQVHQEHERITTIYAAKKVQFKEKYGVDGDEYDRCYDVFGVLRNKKNLERIQAEYKARKEYDRTSRSYYEKFYDNYTSGGSAYTGHSVGGEDKGILKQFYRELSKKYHPDSNPDKDTSEQMKVLNQLKHEWGL